MPETLLMEFAGYLASAFIGISLGLMGGGGSILTVPVLVYLFHVEPVLATAYSLFVVGATSLAGVIPKYKLGLVSLRTAFIFGTPALVAVFTIRAFILPAIPSELFSVKHVMVTKSVLMMVLFAVPMVLASISMIVKRRNLHTAIAPESSKPNYLMLILQGAIVGIVAGFVGAGGGFLIIPGLVLFSKLPMKKAVGTSLLIIGVNSLIGFIGDVAHYRMHWDLLLAITALAIAGIFAGTWLSRKIDGKKLQRGFGWFLLIMGLFIIGKEVWSWQSG